MSEAGEMQGPEVKHGPTTTEVTNGVLARMRSATEAGKVKLSTMAMGGAIATPVLYYLTHGEPKSAAMIGVGIAAAAVTALRE